MRLVQNGVAAAQLDVIQLRSAVERHRVSLGTLDKGMTSIFQRQEALEAKLAKLSLAPPLAGSTPGRQRAARLAHGRRDP